MFRSFWPIGLLLIFNLVFFAKLFFPPSLYTSADFGRGDLTHFHYPLKVLLAESLKSFEIPFWTDQIFGGFPVFSEGQVGALYIPNLVLFGTLPTWLAFNLGYLLTFLTAGTGIFYYLQFLKLSKISSLLGAVAFSFSFFFIGHIIHYSLIQVASLLPWMFLVWEKFLKEKKFSLFLIFSFLLSQAIFAGFAQIFFYSVLAIFTLTIFRIWQIGAKQKIFNLSVFLAALIFASLLSSIQILATQELAAKSGRGFGLPVSEIAKFPYNPANLATFFNPFIFGDPSKTSYPGYSDSWGIFWESASYFGILPLIFAIIGIFFAFFEKSKIFIFFSVFSFFAFLLTLGKFGPLFFLETIPPLFLFRVPSRFIFLVIFGLSCLAAVGFEKIQKRFKVSKILWLVLVLVSFFDLYFVGKDYNGGVSLNNWLARPPTAQFLNQAGFEERVFSIGQFENWNKIYTSQPSGWRGEAGEKLISARAILDPNSNLVWDLTQAYGYAALVPRRNVLVKDLITEAVKTNQDEFEVLPQAEKLLSANSVRFLVSAKKVKSKKFIKVFQGKWGTTDTIYYIYENLENLPKIRLISNAKIVSDLDELTQALISQDFNPKNEVILEKEVPVKNSNITEASLNVISQKSGEIKLEVKLKDPAFLVIANSFNPGWKATLNGVKTEILAANASQQAVFLPKGAYVLVFYYQPYWLKVGGLISGLAHLILFSLLALKLFQRR